MAHSHFISRETLKKKPVLIIDKTGDIGRELCQFLYREFLPIFVSEYPAPEEIKKHVIHIPFKRRAPKIPENSFEQIFFIDQQNPYVRSMFQSVLLYAKSKNISISYITSIYRKKLKTFDQITHNPLVKTFVIGDVFSEDTHSESPVYDMLDTAYHTKKIILHNHGLTEIYTSSAKDVAKGILDLTYTKNHNQDVINLYPDYPTTFLSLARQLILIDPDVKIDFKTLKRKVTHPLWFPQSAWHLSLRPLAQQIKDVYLSFSPSHHEPVKIKTHWFSEIRHKTPSVFGVIGALIAILLVPAMVLGTVGFLGMSLTKKSVVHLENGEYDSSRMTLRSAEATFSLGKTVTKSILPVSAVLGIKPFITDLSNQFDAGLTVTKLLTDMTYGIEHYHLSTQEQNREKSIQLFLTSLRFNKQALIGLIHLYQEGELSETLRTDITPYVEIGSYLLATADVLPDVLGYNTPQTYLILFQNNNELRPGGGFIGSYGIIKIDKGNITKFTIHDVYDADGQLTAKVEPPYALKEYLGASNWFLRDSNFSPDFIENAGRAAYFLNLETRESVDGVFAIDTTFLSGILKATGPVTVDEYNETVNAQNFSEKTQSEIEDNFFPGSQNKRTFLTAVSNDLTEKLLSGKGFSYPILLQQIAAAVKGKHLMMAFANENTQLPFTASNLSGSLWDSRSDKTHINDYIGIVEANLGLNKVNPYIERYINQKSTYTQDGQIQTDLSIRYTNTSNSQTKFGGPYKNYLQLLLPQNADVTGISINGEEKVLLTQEQREVTRNLEGADVKNNLIIERKEIGEKRVVGFLVEVPINQKSDIRVRLQQQTDTAGDARIDYSLKVFKQPGRGQDPYTFTFLYPQSYQLLSQSENMKGKNGEVTSFFLLDADKEFDVSLGKK